MRRLGGVRLARRVGFQAQLRPVLLAVVGGGAGGGEPEGRGCLAVCGEA
jgi:hypothetical protein